MTDISVRQARQSDAVSFLDLWDALDTETEFMLFEPNERCATLDDQKSKLANAEGSQFVHIVVLDDVRSGTLAGFCAGRRQTLEHIYLDIKLNVFYLYAKIDFLSVDQKADTGQGGNMGKKAPKPASHIGKSDWLTKENLWHGLVEGTELNANVTVLFFATDDVGVGPSWHSHPYDEVFIIREGRARFTIGEEVIEAETGDILMGPAAVPHKYHNLGPGRLESIDIHLSPEWIQMDLKDPDA